MKRKLVFLGVMLGLGLADSAMAHTTNVPVTVNGPAVAASGFYSYGWLNGARTKNVKTFGGLTGELVSIYNFGDSHYIDFAGPSGTSTLVKLFTFTALANKTSATITVTDTTAGASAATLDPAISLYSGTLPALAHEVAAPCAAPGANDDGNFNALASFTLCNGATSGTLTFVKSASGVKGGGVNGTVETLTANVTPGVTYTVIVGGERCAPYGKHPYSAGASGGICRNGVSFDPSVGMGPTAANPANPNYSATVKVTQ